MAQTSQERLRIYLAELPPQAQALLMREFERAIERGEDTAVATYVLEELRKVVRGADEDSRPRTDDPARLVFRPLQPFLVDGSFPRRPGQIRRASLAPIWQWLVREGAPEQAQAFEAALFGLRSNEPASSAAAIRTFQQAAADAMVAIASPGFGGDNRALARVGAPDVIEDLLPIGLLLRAREAVETLNGRLPTHYRTFAESQIAAATEAL